jgi:hypothetical protein
LGTNSPFFKEVATITIVFSSGPGLCRCPSDFARSFTGTVVIQCLKGKMQQKKSEISSMLFLFRDTNSRINEEED